MSLRIDTSEWIPGALVIGDVGGGVLAEDIPSTGDDGPPYAYNDLAFPGDNGKEICGRITTWPSAGALYAYEDTSFTFTGAPDGSYTFQYQLYVDYVAVGSPTTVALTVGATSATASGATLTGTSSLTAGAATGQISAIADGATLTGTSSLTPGGATGVSAGTAPGATLTGTASMSAGAATGQVNAAAAGATLTGTSSLSAGAAEGTAPGVAPGATLTALANIVGGSATGQQSATASGVTLTALATLTAGAASALQYARAPRGSGYSRPFENSTRPTQQNTKRTPR